jgi:hypothetical protein
MSSRVSIARRFAAIRRCMRRGGRMAQNPPPPRPPVPAIRWSRKLPRRKILGSRDRRLQTECRSVPSTSPVRPVSPIENDRTAGAFEASYESVKRFASGCYGMSIRNSEQFDRLEFERCRRSATISSVLAERRRIASKPGRHRARDNIKQKAERADDEYYRCQFGIRQPIPRIQN